MEKLVLIDGNSLINRAFYAMPLLMTKDGIPTNAVHGFMNMLFKMLAEEKPTYLAVAFDLKAPTFRHKKYAEYKGTRKPMPEELRPQIPLLKEVLKKMKIAALELEGYEADDIIGTLAKRSDIKTLIYTGDRDAFQLVDDKISVCFTKKGISELDVYEEDNFTEKTELSPYQIIELKALMGDSSDNIPGVAGIGEKTAKTLLKEYKTVDNLYQNVGKLSGKLKEKIESGKESCYLSKDLATIDINVPINVDNDEMKVNIPFPAEAKEFLLSLELKKVALSGFFSEESGGDKANEKTVKLKTVNDKNEFIKSVTKKEITAFVCDTFIAVFDGENENRIVIKQSLLDEGYESGEALKILYLAIQVAAKVIIHSKKELRKLFFSIGVEDNFDAEDISLIKYLTDFGGGETASDVIENYSLSKETPSFSLYQIYLNLVEKLKEGNNEKLYKDLELPLSDVLFEMEKDGFKIDLNALDDAENDYNLRLKSIEKEIIDLLGEDININSPKQLGALLFEKLKIGKGKKTKSGYSTSADVLEKYEDAHPVIPLILRYRKIQKIYSTYIQGFNSLADRKTGLIHTVFNQTVTATGRLSSKEPNLQNIPVRDEEGKFLRKLFVSRNENGELISADYSQIELRLLAAFSDCTGLINAFSEEKDVHSATAARVFGIDIKEVTPDMRRKAKAVNFGIIYGISEYGLSNNLKIPVYEAKRYIENYFREYPEVKAYMDKNVALCHEKGYAETFIGRRRFIREINSSNYAVRQFGERAAMNMPLQGASADIIKMAMIAVYNRLKKENLKSKLVLQVHDELIIDAANGEEDKVKNILKEEMENAVSLKVKLTVEINAGKNLYEAK